MGGRHKLASFLCGFGRDVNYRCLDELIGCLIYCTERTGSNLGCGFVWRVAQNRRWKREVMFPLCNFMAFFKLCFGL